MLGSLNLQVGYWDIFWPQFLQGLSMGLIFVPLTTVTMSLIPREEIGNATSIFNLMRNMGGSVGIALSGMVSQQAVMVAFVQLFRVLALVFAIVVPLVFIMRRPKAGQPATPAH